MDALGSREETLRRALVMAIPVGTQLGGIGLNAASASLDAGLRLATWTLAGALRTAGAGAALLNRAVLVPAASFAFGSQQPSSSIRFCTQTCPQLVPEAQGRKHATSRTAVRLQRLESKLRTGGAKCSMRKQTPRAAAAAAKAAASVAPILLAHFAAACALSPPASASASSSFSSASEVHDEAFGGRGSSRCVDEASLAVWAVNNLGLQSSML